MPRWFTSTLFAVTTLTVTTAFSSGTANDTLRYRGEYTYGHEVRVFCPAINSQCYWVDTDTPASALAVLNEIATRDKNATVSGSAPYTPVCVVIEARIDRETLRTGFAANYDGLISVARVFDRCDETDIVTQGDLQHHRWLLDSINGETLDVDARDGIVHDLDFGERMTVSGNSGCNRFRGQAVLREEFFAIDRIASTRRVCAPAQNDVERTVLLVLGGESEIRIDDERHLILKSRHAVLRYFLSDWKN